MIPKKAFDREYSTQSYKEMLYLKDKKIYPVFIKKNDTYGVITWKYTKTAELFREVANFYEQDANRKDFYKMVHTVNNVKKLMVDA